MVRLVATAVYFRSVGLQVWRAQYVVNAHTDATLVIGPAGSCARGNEAVGEGRWQHDDGYTIWESR